MIITMMPRRAGLDASMSMSMNVCFLNGKRPVGVFCNLVVVLRMSALLEFLNFSTYGFVFLAVTCRLHKRHVVRYHGDA